MISVEKARQNLGNDQDTGEIFCSCNVCDKNVTRTRHHVVMSLRTRYHLVVFTLLGFLLTFVHGQGPGEQDEFSLEVFEERGPNINVGSVVLRTGLNYRISNGEYSNLFRLDSNGLITTTQKIDREELTSDTIELTITTFPDVTHIIEVSVKVLDINDNNPRFPTPTAERFFSETSSKGTQVYLEKATDPDLGINSVSDTYEIVSGNEENKFRLVIESSVLYLENNFKLDREEKAFYTLNISAQDNGSPKRYGYRRLDITVRDSNDNHPLFDQSDYTVVINETAPPGSSVLTVSATDQDTDENAEISYQLTSETDQFWIEPKSGEIRTLKTLNCRSACDVNSEDCQQKRCLLSVEARDNGKPLPLTGRAFVTVVLLDENDHDPVITFRSSGDHGEAFVDEGARINNTVDIVTVSDEDDGQNGNTSIHITKGNERGHFWLHQLTSEVTVIRVAAKLDREKISKYNLTVEARDMGSPARTSSAYIVIWVNDINDHKPVFKKSLYRSELSELVPEGSFVAAVGAMDNDTGINAVIKYSIKSGNSKDWFQINPSTGLLTTKSKLDREQQAAFLLKIEAKDSGATFYVSYTNVSISIWDENDEVPKFSSASYSVTLEDGMEPGNLPVSTTAVDRDQGPNGTIVYEFHPSVNVKYPNMFSVTRDSGIIATLQTIDREEYDSFELELIAKDNGNTALSSTATIFISVSDVNDNVPIFYPTVYYAAVTENHPAVSLVTVTAIDADYGENGTVIYSIFSGANQDFTIDPTTGTVATTKPLQKSNYDLSIKAEDKMGKEAVQHAQVHIWVKSEDDNIPVYTDDQYIFSVSEDDGRGSHSGGKPVDTITASYSQTLRYSIVDGDPADLFVINSATGAISANELLDREMSPIHKLTVVAVPTEAGNGAFAETSVNIVVLDINDNVPEFQLTETTVFVEEDSPVGKEVFYAKATDSDYKENSTLTYFFQGGGPSEFQIDASTGVISLTSSWVSREKEVFELSVVAQDNGTSEKLSSVVDLVIIVDDVNDHTPMFDSPNYEIAFSESLPVNERFFKLAATDSDKGMNGQIMYEMVDGNREGKFGVFPDGVLYVAQPLDREEKDLYVLRIRAQDNGEETRSSMTNVTIRILDDNDNDPVFTNETFEFYLEENSDIGLSIGTLSAYDLDLGKNQEVFYFFDSNNHGFDINPHSGMISNKQRYDREELMKTSGTSELSFSVVVRDSGDIVRSSRAVAIVTITDVNDMAPVFSKEIYEASVFEDFKDDSPILNIWATDEDLNENAELRYYILNGNVGNVFSLDEETGDVFVSGSLDREVKDIYHIEVMVEDLGIPPLNTTSLLRIKVKDANDNFPIFKESPTSFEIYEYEWPGYYVTRFTATDNDLGENGRVMYSITGGNANSAFTIESRMGKLFVAFLLDYEEQSSYNLTITASDQGLQPKESSLEVTIKILDENDNAPVFPTGTVTREITENIETGTRVYTVAATDVDSGLNGEIEYSITSQKPSGSHFEINSETGEIRTDGDIDREVASEYTLTLRATDKAIPESNRLYTEKDISIQVLDENDNEPVFISQNAAAVLLNTDNKTVVTRVIASDKDSGLNSALRYTLSTGEDLFRITPTNGELYLVSQLRSQTLYRNIAVKVEDQGDPKKQAFHSMTIIVRENVESGPEFTQTKYSVSIPENEDEGTSVITVSASYTGNRENSGIEYYITKVTSDGTDVPRYFEIKNPSSGTILTTQPLDRESGQVYRIEVTAMDTEASSPSTRSVMVEVTVLDENDTPPTFDLDLWEVEVAEDQTPGETIMVITASDKDKEGSLVYSIVEGAAEKFSIDPAQGALSVVTALDRETQDKYMLTVAADDGVQSSTATVVVMVTDVNDESPEFLEQEYYFDIPENTDTGLSVGQIAAMDRDLGSNAEVTYSIQSHWARDTFSLDRNTGVFTLIRSLDYEETQQYRLTIKAQDRGSGTQQSSTVYVFMNVLDENDNNPLFDPSSYSIQVSEGTEVGTSIMEVTATDIDSALHSEVRYSLIGGDSRGVFRVDALNGSLYVAGALDRERQDYYNLVVEARDLTPQPGTSLSSTCLISVTVTDINDNVPVFQTPPTITVSESTNGGDQIFTLVAIDLDEGQDGEVEYSLVSSADNLFSIQKDTGVLTLNQEVDRETKNEYEITVKAMDKGSPPLANQALLTVLVGDANDHTPKFAVKSSYNKTISEDILVGKSVLTLEATDDDTGINAELRFIIMAGDNDQAFFLDSHTGSLSVNSRLDYETRSLYHLKVMVYDLGEPQLSDITDVFISLTDINDCQPMFADLPYKFSVQENAATLPVFVGRVKGRDCDSGYNAVLSYSIAEGGESKFQIDKDTGEITAHQRLDREVTPHYDVVVTVVDSGSPRLSGFVAITILVADENDNTPEFEHAHYRGKVQENAATPAYVTTVTAVDQDTENNGKITYSLVSDGHGQFSVDSETGVITTTTGVDREHLATYSLIVMAADNGVKPRSSTVHVSVSVQDQNDNSPEFDSTEYSLNIRDPTEEGNFVGGVMAIDHDEGQNGQLHYNLVESSNDFSIDSQTGVITASRRLTNSGQVHSLEVKATDQGAPPRSTTVNVNIAFLPSFVTDFPSISQSTGSLIISEATSLNDILASVSSVSSVTYFIAAGNQDNTFKVNQDGEISLDRHLDYEKVIRYNLWVGGRMYSQGQPVASFIEFDITVTDENDSPPVFELLYYNATVHENEAAPVRVVSVVASDADSDENGRVTYDLVSGNEENDFQINAVGQISTRARLDRETIDVYKLVVTATDHGSPQHTATTTVDIRVLDKNDVSPSFKQHFNVLIPENLKIDSSIVQVSTIDPDDAVVSYSFQKSYPAFAIDETSGWVTLVQPLDRELKASQYVLTVAANDDHYNRETQITIDVLDINDNPPEFEEEAYSFSVAQGQELGTILGEVYAVDYDGPGLNSDVWYKLKTPQDWFAVDEESGLVSVREQVHFVDSPNVIDNQHIFTIVASDRGDPVLSSEVTVTVTVMPANENVPEFEESAYYFYVSEYSEVDRTVGQVHASDADSGPNGEVVYSIVEGNGTTLFGVDSQTGILRVRSFVVGQRSLSYTLTLKAEDRGSPVLSAMATVTLTVIEVNGQTPQFINTDYSVLVPENKTVDTSILQVRAQDNDPGVNGKLLYSIKAGDPLGFFSINPESGEVTLGKQLDYERFASYALTVLVKDKAPISKNASATFIVDIVNINDSPPTFSVPQYDAYIPENLPADTTVYELTAVDKDESLTGIVYQLLGTGKEKFGIDRSTGVVTTETMLDYEEKAEYSFTVEASNPSSEMTGTATLAVHVTGVNEFAPQFETKTYNFDMNEAVGLNYIVGYVKATDQDNGIDGQVEYHLLGDSNLYDFVVNIHTGAISVVGTIDREAESKIELQVMAKNSGPVHGVNVDYCQVIIDVGDANDPPRFTESTYEAMIREDADVGDFVIQVEAKDNDFKDDNSVFYYSILSGNLGLAFDVDRESGEVTVAAGLDRETTDVYILELAATDTGLPPRTGTTTLEITLEDVNDNSPYFDPTIPVGSLREENDNPSSEVAIDLKDYTNDHDIGPNEIQVYRYQLLDSTDKFEVGETSGLVRAKVRLDREKQAEYTLSLRVSDSGVPPLTSTLTFKIEVIDINDKPSYSRAVDVEVYLFSSVVIEDDSIADVRPRDSDIVGDYSCDLKKPHPTQFSITTACDLMVSVGIQLNTEYVLQLSGSDGIHSEAEVTATVSFRSFSSDMIDRTAVVRLSAITASTFIEDYYSNFVAKIKRVVASEGNVELYSMVETGQDLDLFIASVSSGGKVMSKGVLIQLIESNNASIESETGVRIKDANFNPCRKNPCQNNGECSVKIEVGSEYISHDTNDLVVTSTLVQQNIICQCTDEFIGDRCEEPINKCLTNPCKNQGTCIGGDDNSFTCKCPDNWQGNTCEVDVNECQGNSPCLNGGTCRNSAGSYDCDCLLAYTGKHCTIEVRSCSLRPCKNDGECIDLENGYECRCGFGYRGKNCDVESRGFQSLSYMQYSLELDEIRNEITIEVATVMKNALLLLYRSESSYEYLALELVDGFVELSFFLGNEESASDEDIVRMRNPVRVDDGQWYSISVVRESKVGTVRVSRCLEDEAQCEECLPNDVSCSVQANGGSYQSLSASDVRLYVGGVSDISILTSHPGQVSSHDFVGCLRSVNVDRKEMFQLTPTQSNGTTDTCPRQADGVCPADGTSSLCGEGVCVDKWNSHGCRCPGDKGGDTCSQDASSLSFGDNSVAKYSLKESYKRDVQLVSGSDTRQRRAVSNDYSFMIKFMTYEKNGVLLQTTTNSEYLLVQLNDGKMECVTGRGSFTVDQEVNDGEWYTLNLRHTGSSLSAEVGGSTAGGSANAIPNGLWDRFSVGGTHSSSGVSGDAAGFKGCLEEFKVNGETLPTSGYSDKYDITVEGDVSSTCDAYMELAGKDGPPTTVVIVVICVLFAVILIGVLLAFVFIVYRRRQKEKKASSFQNGAVMCKTNGSVIGGKNKANNDSGRSNPDSGIAADENIIITQHIEQELNNGTFDEREIRSSLQSSRPDVIEPGVSVADKATDESDEGCDNNGFFDGPIEHYDFDNASSIAPSDLLDYTQHYKKYRLRQLPTHNKYTGSNKSHLHNRHTPSPSAMLANRQSPASVSMIGRQSPADLLARQTPPHKSDLTVENVNQLNRQIPVNQLSRASPAPNNIPPSRDRMTSPFVQNSMRSTPMSGLYPSNISNSTSYSESTTPMANGHVRTSRPNSKLKQPINQVGLRGTPNKGLTIEEVNRLNARHTPTPLDVISSSSEEVGQNNINQTDFTHSDLLEPSNSMLPPESSSEEETNDSFTCSEFEDDHAKIRNDLHPGRQLFSKLPRVNENEDTDTTLSRGHNDSDSNKESISTFFTASEDELPHKLSKTKLPNGALSLDYMLNWGPNYEKLVGVFVDIAHLPQPTDSKDINTKMSPVSSSNQRPVSRSSDNSSPKLNVPPKASRVASPGMRATGQGVPRHMRSSLPPSPLVGNKNGVVVLNGQHNHMKQPSTASAASSHDRQSSISSLQSSGHAPQLFTPPNHSRSSSTHSGAGAVVGATQEVQSPHQYPPPPPYPHSRTNSALANLPVSHSRSSSSHSAQQLPYMLDQPTYANQPFIHANLSPPNHSRSSSRSSLSTHPSQSNNSMYNPMKNPYPPPPPPSIAQAIQAVEGATVSNPAPLPAREEYV